MNPRIVRLRGLCFAALMVFTHWTKSLPKKRHYLVFVSYRPNPPTKRQREIINSLSLCYTAGISCHELDRLSTRLNLVSFPLPATYRRWPAICQTTPQLWGYAFVPMLLPTHDGNNIIGKAQFERCIVLAQNNHLNSRYIHYDTAYHGANYPDLVLPAGSQILRVNIVCDQSSVISREVPSPTELCVLGSADSPGRSAYILPPELLVNTKKLRCTEITPSFSGRPAGVQSLHIVLRQSGAPQFRELLEHCPKLQELYLEVFMVPSTLSPRLRSHLRLLSSCLLKIGQARARAAHALRLTTHFVRFAPILVRLHPMTSTVSPTGDFPTSIPAVPSSLPSPPFRDRSVRDGLHSPIGH